jgi:predicted ABC-type ATPase
MAPQFVIVAGPNGCGKSSTGSARVKQQLDITAIDPDAIVRDYRTHYPDWPDDALNLAAVLEAERRVWKAISRGESVGVETVLSSVKYLDAVNAAKARGFETVLYFVTVATADLAVERVRERVRQKGHDVPEQKIRARWPRTHQNAADLFARVDSAFAYDFGLWRARVRVQRRIGRPKARRPDATAAAS